MYVWDLIDKNTNCKTHFKPHAVSQTHQELNNESMNSVTSTVMFDMAGNKNVHYLQKFVEEECEPVSQHFLSDRLCPANMHKAHNEHAIPVLISPT